MARHRHDLGNSRSQPWNRRSDRRAERTFRRPKLPLVRTGVLVLHGARALQPEQRETARPIVCKLMMLFGRRLRKPFDFRENAA
jgi:hypothetical protein